MVKISTIALAIPLFLYTVISRLTIGALNKRSIFKFVFIFWLNFSPVFIWLTIFKQAGVIPNDIRPPINVRLAKNLDLFIFDESRFSAWLSLMMILSLSYLFWVRWYKIDSSLIFFNNESIQQKHVLDDPIFTIDDTVDDVESQRVRNKSLNRVNSTTNNDSSSSSFTISSNTTPTGSSRALSPPTTTCTDSLIYLPKNCFYYAQPLLLSFCWIILNIDHALIGTFTKSLDITAWVSYVIFHFCAPLFTAIYLYVFQTPAALKWFSMALGAQNIAGVFTHLLFPNAPPWFIRLYGEDAQANYDMPGYAAGLIRVDVAMGTHISSKGFHKSPIVFGALPSLHSAIAAQSFFFISYYTVWTWPKIGMLLFVVLQWWATMYLDHHWRLDLIVGLIYAIVSFTIFKKYLIRSEKKFVDARLKGDFEHGSTMGMRVFKGHWIGKFFDPYNENRFF